MPNILIIARTIESVSELHLKLSRNGFACSIFTGKNGLTQEIAKANPDLVLVAAEHYPEILPISRIIKERETMPVMLLIKKSMLDNIDHYHEVDDFITEPYDLAELKLRLKRLSHRNEAEGHDELIQRGDLIIDLGKCEVSVGVRPVMLTFREYELLKFMVTNSGRTFTRENLLDKVWGYDYFGGDRTVDVHIRRLRSKLEDATHTFFDTVRNIGYRFKEA